MRKDTFSACHPLVNFVFFLLVLLLTMFWMHPVSLGISLASAVLYGSYLHGGRAVLRQMRYLLPLFLLTALLNPVFNHEGVTILCYLPNGNPLTLEAIVYGLAAAGMLVAVVTWFSCFNTVMTSDKFIYLFGRVIPALSLLLSMMFRLIPRLQEHMRQVWQTQKAAGPDGRFRKLRGALTVFSATVTWAMENAIDTADSMKSRGYGLPGRTAFSIYRFTRRDGAVLVALLALGGYTALSAAMGKLHFQYYPMLSGARTGVYAVSVELCYAALCLLPLMLGIWEDYKWNSFASKI